jgi:hypothetical protein
MVQPATAAESIDLFETARELAFMLWTLDEAANCAQAYEISEEAATLYQLEVACVDAPWLLPAAAESFKRLAVAARPGIEIMKLNPDLGDFLNPDDPLQGLALSLIQCNGDLATAASLLTLAAMDEQQRKALVKDNGEAIDSHLRGLEGPLLLGEIENLFKMWSMGVLTLAPADSASEIKAKLAEIGSMLLTLTDFAMVREQRQDTCILVRNAIRPFLEFGDDQESVDVLKQFLSAADDPSGSKSYEVGFNLEPSDLTVPIGILKKLSGLLSDFQHEPRVNA